MRFDTESPPFWRGILLSVDPKALTQFYRKVNVWPKTREDRNLVSDQILELLGVTFVCVFFEGFEAGPQSDSGVGISVQSVQGGADQNINWTHFSTFLKEQLRAFEKQNPQEGIKLIQIPLGAIRFPFSETVQNLSYLLSYPFETGGGFKGIAIGSPQRLTPDEESCFIAVYERMKSLAQIMELNTNLQIRSQFLSIASHELKTPLTSIYGILQLQERMLRLRADQTPFPDQERHHNFLKMVIRQVERLNELIDGLLDVSRIQNGRFMVEPTDVDVAALLRESIEPRLSVIAKEAGVKLHVDIIPQLIAKVDPVRMEEVINNLVMNAIRFSPEGGVVWIRLRDEEGAFRLTVRDQGPSIPIEDRERIFQPFEQAQRTARMGGLGLGLYISRQIALLHGGNVSLVESVPGKGNVFESYFPIRPPL